MKILYFILFVIISSNLYSEDLTKCQEGWAQTEIGNYKKAIELFKKCVKTGKLTKGSLARTYRNMGIACNRDKQFKEAIEYYNKALELKPADSWDDYVNRGNAWSGLDDYKKAMADYDKALEIKPNYNQVFYNRGIVLEKQNKRDDALKEFKKAYQYGLRSQLLYERFIIYGLIAKPGELKLPTPPEGFKWARCPKIKGAFLCPNDWHFKKHQQGETLGFFITKEKITDKKQFMTGLTVNVMPKIPEKKSMTPYKFAELFRDNAKKINKIIKEWDKDMGPFKSLGFVYTKKDKAGDFTVHNLLIANNKTGTLYIVLFEAPTSEWEKTWKIAEPMLKYLYIDDTI